MGVTFNCSVCIQIEKVPQTVLHSWKHAAVCKINVFIALTSPSVSLRDAFQTTKNYNGRKVVHFCIFDERVGFF